MENAEIANPVERLPDGIEIVRTTTSGGRSGHLRMLAMAMATAAAMHPTPPRTEDQEPRTHLPFGGLSYSSGKRDAVRTSGHGQPFAAVKRAARKAKKKMRKQSRKK
jgi:hypothetical protein